MKNIISLSPSKIICDIIPKQHYFPNNAVYPFLIYKDVLSLSDVFIKDIQKLLEKNKWKNSWIDSIYTYHHYHSNTHEVLVIFSGEARVQMGGPEGKVYNITAGDVLIIPAGVSHKNVASSPDFKTIGAYPFNIQYDMNMGKADEVIKAKANIEKTGLPKTDPIFGKNGMLFTYWKINK